MEHFSQLNSKTNISFVECPRDAMQGWQGMIPTEKKIEYINSLLQVGFDTIDFGSFVSPKAIPQMADTREVLNGLDLRYKKSRLLAIAANTRGAQDACEYEAIDCIGFPFSISETFQQRNANSSIDQALDSVKKIYSLTQASGKQLVIYISMGFGNPYGDPYNTALVLDWIEKIMDCGINTISLADTVGIATADEVGFLTGKAISGFPTCTVGVHLHSTVTNWKAKVDAALTAGCRRFDGALKGIGGCPFAGDELVGNINSELLISYFTSLGLLNGIDEHALASSLRLAEAIFSDHDHHNQFQ